MCVWWCGCAEARIPYMLLVSTLRNIHEVINIWSYRNSTWKCSRTHHVFLVLSRMENPPVITVFLCGQLKMTKNFMYTLPFLLQLGRVASEEATVDFWRKTLQEKKLQNQHQWVHSHFCLCVQNWCVILTYFMCSLFLPPPPPPPLSLSFCLLAFSLFSFSFFLLLPPSCPHNLLEFSLLCL